VIQVDTVRVTLPLRKKFTVSKGAAEAKTNVLTILNNRYNGEASGSVHAGPSIEVIEKDLKKGVKLLEKHDIVTVQTLQEINKFKIHPVARSALMGMVLNYVSGESQRYPWEVLELSTPVGIKTSLTISLDDPEEMLNAIRETTHPILKIKLGGDTDLEFLEKLQQISDKEIRVDANGGWTCEQAEEIIFYLGKMGVVIVEQPTDIDHIKDWPHLKGKNEDIQLIMDEGLNTLKDFKKYAEYIDGINVKMEKTGGILEAVRLSHAAREKEKKIMLGCMVESSVGIAQSVYMSSLADYHDLDAPQLLENDIAQGITYKQEAIEVDREIIGGPKLKRDVVEKYSNE
jgi:L-alanine-DL-glutamate epimerase-like enolase superfamily enzyme